MIKVLFVCTGNICRSCSAEALLRLRAKEQGRSRDFEIDSAGTHAYHVGEPPDHRAITVAQARGISMQGLYARKVTQADFEKFDTILAMDQGHYDILEEIRPAESKAHLTLFMDFSSQHDEREVPDPYYGELEGYESMLDLLEAGIEGFLNEFES